MSKSKQRSCAFAGSMIALIWGVIFIALSWTAVTSIRSDTWVAVDYWMAWFSALTLIGAAVMGLLSTVQMIAALDCKEE